MPVGDWLAASFLGPILLGVERCRGRCVYTNVLASSAERLGYSRIGRVALFPRNVSLKHTSMRDRDKHFLSYQPLRFIAGVRKSKKERGTDGQTEK